MGREYIRKVLKDMKGLGTHATRDFLQVCGLCFPTAAMVNKYTKGRTAELCPLYSQDPETTAHMLMGCRVTQGACNKLHDRVAESLLSSIREAGLQGVKVWSRPVGWKLFRKFGEEIGTHLTGVTGWTPPVRLTDHEYWRRVWSITRSKVQAANTPHSPERFGGGEWHLCWWGKIQIPLQEPKEFCSRTSIGQ
jgi:hypothetical protein